LLSTQDAILALKATDFMALPVKANQAPQACRFIIAIDPESHCNNWTCV